MITKYYSEMAYPQEFDFKVLESLTSFKKRLDYVQSHLRRISSGSSRIVYEVDNEKVLKVAKNKKGIDQNLVESTYYFQDYDIVARVFNSSDDGLFIEMEKASKLTKSEFKKLTGISIEDLYQYIRYFENPKYSFKPNNYDELSDLDFMVELMMFAGDNQLPMGDFARLSSYGKVKRDGKDTVVLIDFGLDIETYNKHYKR